MLPTPSVNQSINQPDLNQLKLDFESAITSGAQEKVREIVKKFSGLVNIPLSSGALPLHFSIDHNMQAVTEMLLPYADLESKDSHEMDAFDHAVAINSRPAQIAILKSISKKTPKIQEEIQVIEYFLKAIKEVVDKQKEEIDEKTFEKIQVFLNTKDKNNRIPLEYAILTRQLDVFLQLDASGADVKAKLHDGSSLLSLAVKNGLSAFVHLLLYKGLDPNETDDKGNSLLSQAISQGATHTVYLLLAYGARPTAKDIQAWKSLSRTRDPLQINSTEKWICLSSAAYWLAQGAAVAGYPYASYAPMAVHLIGTAAFASYLLSDVKSSWKKAASVISMTALETLPGIGLGIQAWKTAQTAYTAVNSAIAAKEKWTERPWHAIRKVTVSTVNAVQSMYMLKKVAVRDYQSSQEIKKDREAAFNWFLKEKHWESEWQRCTKMELICNENPETHVVDCNTCEKVLNTAPYCQSVDADFYNAQTNPLETISSPELKWYCPEHIKLMLTKNFDEKQFKLNGARYVNGLNRKFLAKYHPDKYQYVPTETPMSFMEQVTYRTKQFFNLFQPYRESPLDDIKIDLNAASSKLSLASEYLVESIKRKNLNPPDYSDSSFEMKLLEN